MTISSPPRTLSEAGRLFNEALRNQASEEVIDQIVEQTTKLCHGSFFPFIKEFSQSPFPGNIILFNRVFASISKKLKTDPLSGRLLYQIDLNDEAVGYIIGTVHDSTHTLGQNAAVNSDPLFHDTVRKCKALVTELGGLSTGLDGALVKTAHMCGIPVFALETEAFQNDITKKIISKKKQHIKEMTTEVLERFNYAASSPDLFTTLGLYSYLTCDIGELATIKNMDSEFENCIQRVRHEDWLTSPMTKIPGLEIMLQPSQHTPLCIAIDAMDLFGEDGIIKKLSSGSFTISFKGDAQTG